MSSIHPNEIKEVVGIAKNIFRGTGLERLLEKLLVRSDSFSDVIRWVDVSNKLVSLGGMSNTQDIKSIASALEFMDLLREAEASDRVQFIEVCIMQSVIVHSF